MNFFVLMLIQIGDLLKGNFTWRGFIQLVLFLLMGAIVMLFTGFIIQKALGIGDKK